VSETDPTQGENDNVAERNAGYLRALDLHDETGQILTAILVNLQRIGGIATGSDVGETVRDTQHLVETLFYSIRNFIRDSAGVAPARSLPPPELGPALRRLTKGFSRRTGIEVDLRYDPDTERVPGEHKAVFYRVVQESLTNVFRHSGARRVTIRFSRSESSVDLEIGDDGGSRGRALRVGAAAVVPGGVLGPAPGSRVRGHGSGPDRAATAHPIRCQDAQEVAFLFPPARPAG